MNNALNAGEFLLRPLRRLQIAKYNDTTVVVGCQGRFKMQLVHTRGNTRVWEQGRPALVASPRVRCPRSQEKCEHLLVNDSPLTIPRPVAASVTIALMNGAGMHAPDSAAVVSPSRYNGSMRVYLDNCCFQRPLDNKSQVRVRLESEAVLAILSLWEQHQIEVISSEALEFELAQNPDPVRRAWIVSGAAIRVQVDYAISMRAKELEAGGLRGMDALHIACAEAAGADYFCSCDDRLLRRARVIEGLRVKVVSLLVLAGELAQ